MTIYKLDITVTPTFISFIYKAEPLHGILSIDFINEWEHLVVAALCLIMNYSLFHILSSLYKQSEGPISRTRWCQVMTECPTLFVVSERSRHVTRCSRITETRKRKGRTLIKRHLKLNGFSQSTLFSGEMLKIKKMFVHLFIYIYFNGNSPTTNKVQTQRFIVFQT